MTLIQLQKFWDVAMLRCSIFQFSLSTKAFRILRIWMAEVFHSVIYDIIQKGGNAGKITITGAKKLKLEKGILLDNYVRRGPRLVDAQARSLLIYSRRSKRHMSLKKHKKCDSFDRWYIPQVLDSY
ncbi:unnamed protein product [Miscanthus lutarioriparius]|uniref:Uncharacterized protein n=1 Tax=Miscanthus lutarioriparius TaxID=422564 RepID=A0A811SEK8_9POAL|nr:unnamed protein product [Miscanthus lutarioriparius]